MIIVRATQKLLKLNKIKPEHVLPPPIAPLGEWYANVIPLSPPGQSAVIYTHNPSRLTVIVRGKSINTTIKEFEPRLLLLLFRLGASDELIARQQKAMQEVVFGKTDSRSMLGSMNEIASNIQYGAEEVGGIENLSLNSVENKLSDLLFGAKEMGKGYFKPHDYLKGHVFVNLN